MYGRHGPFFTDRLLIHDHINRLTSGVHGDTGSIQYFLGSSATARFPWIGLLPLALGGWLLPGSRRAAHARAQQRSDAPRSLLALWFAAAFTLFSAMITKFHHYIFPAVPPLAMLIGRAARSHARASAHRATRARAGRASRLRCSRPLALVLGVGRAARRRARRAARAASTPRQQADLGRCSTRGRTPVCARCSIARWRARAAARCAACGQHRGAARASPGRSTAERALGAGLIAGALLCAFVGRDLSLGHRQAARRPRAADRAVRLQLRPPLPRPPRLPADPQPASRSSLRAARRSRRCARCARWPSTAALGLRFAFSACSRSTCT